MSTLTNTRAGVLATRFVAAALLLALVVSAAMWWIFSGSGQHHVTAYFTRAVGVYPGSDVRVLGVRIGQVDKVTPRGEQVQVDMSVDGSVGIAEDTTLLVIAPSVVADRYLQFAKPARGGARLPDGATIPVQRTATPVELDQLYASLDTISKALGPNGANSQGALSDLLKTGAQNLQGNGRAFNDSVRNFAQLARTLAGNSTDLFGTVDQLQQFTTMLATNDSQVSNVNQQLSQISATLAADSGDLARALDGLGRALGDVQAFIHDNRGALKANVDNLVTTTRTLVEQRESLAGTLDAVPLAVSNVLNAVDPATGRLRGRGNFDYYLQPLPLPVTGDVYTNGGQR
ncbi:MCE family protein [Amycolatopsis sp. NPDC051102]|uniref:MCE family protein n=1 Tax=Amycolatopsis sp. NPDC051102 TaxID=3155163 RepID=UPI00341ABA0B